VEFSPSVDQQNVSDALPLVRTSTIGRTCIPRGSSGIEKLIWACPACGTIGTIKAHGKRINCSHCGAEWQLDRDLNVRLNNESKTSLHEFASSLNDNNLFKDLERLSSLGDVDVLTGGQQLSRVDSGQLTYKEGELHVSGKALPLADARIIRVEGKDRLDIGFPKDRRLRVIFHRDSPLKWQRYLRFKLDIDMQEE
jgi:ribosomal protein S27AE